MAFAQNRQIPGRVTDDKEDPVPFASSIKIKKTKIGTAADEAGNFKLSIRANAVPEKSASVLETQETSAAGEGEGCSQILTDYINK